MASILVMLAMFVFGCKEKSVQQSVQSQPREQAAVLLTDSVSTLISDSGVTRYRIEAPQWLMCEQFDLDLSVAASLKADYAYYDETAQRWTLIGNVHAMNRQGEKFETPKMMWDQQTHRVYSDTSIHITRENSIIEGVGFDSNEQMTQYTILNPTGVFPIKDE